MTFGERTRRTGASHLERQSALRKRIQDGGLSPTILLVEDERLDVHFVETPLRRMFGERTRIDVAADIDAMTQAIGNTSYDVVLLDDRLGPSKAEATVPLLRAELPDTPTIVFSRLMTHKRKAELNRLGCPHVLGKEDLDSVTLSEMILSALGHKL